ncbi:MAG: hypothetical protein LBS74_07695 [Oscillospiraceae bacterium]|nr:hypothetical protein [Oscillospiraceae bacterium]
MKTKLSSHKVLLKTISLILALTVCLTSLPLSTNAVLEDPFGREGNSFNYNSYSGDGSPSVIAEDSSLRAENSKTYLRSDGSKVAYIYSEPIHYFDAAKDAWQNYDNTLALATNDDGTLTYKNKNSDIEITLPESLSSEDALSVNADIKSA